MSSKKDKILESAQKFILKGQLDRAIKDYEQVVSLDPGDIRHRQRLAELFVRVNRKEDAIGEYQAIGKHYAGNAYYLKAIAVYKQIQKLDPDDITITLELASLNQKQGLTGNALAEYSRVYSHYEKSGKRTQALSILENMIAIDPDNLNTRLKFAETRFAAGSAEKAYEDFVQVALLLKKRGEETAHDQVWDRIHLLFPEKKGFLLETLAAQLHAGEAASAIPGLEEITRTEEGNLAAWDLLVDALLSTGDSEKLQGVLQKMMSIFSGELSIKERAIQCTFQSGDIDNAIAMLERYRPAFFEKDAFASLERLYHNLFEGMPDDARLLQGLRELYQRSNQGKKLTEVVDRLSILTQKGVPSQSEPPMDMPNAPLRQPGSEEEDGAAASANASVEMVLASMVESLFSAEQELPADENPATVHVLEETDIELDLSTEDLPDLAEYDDEPADTTCDAADEPPVAPALHLELSVDELDEDIELDLSSEDLPDLAEYYDEPDDTTCDAADEPPVAPALHLELSVDELDEDVELELDLNAEDDAFDDDVKEIDLEIELPESGLYEHEELLLASSEIPILPELPCQTAATDTINAEILLCSDPVSSIEDDDFDEEFELGDELLEIYSDDAGHAAGRGNGPDPLPSGIRKGQHLDEEDTETHYNLGIAFKEMGLHDDAIAEFQAASLDPARKVDCMTLQGTCCREKGDYERSLSILNQGLDLADLVPEQVSPLNYELALLYEAMGEKDKALGLYRKIQTLEDMAFRDTAERIAVLQGDEAIEDYEMDLVELDGELEPF